MLAIQLLRKALKHYRHERGHGAWRELSARTGLHSTNIGRIARGEQDPTEETWQKMYVGAPDVVPPPSIFVMVQDGDDVSYTVRPVSEIGNIRKAILGLDTEALQNYQEGAAIRIPVPKPREADSYRLIPCINSTLNAHSGKVVHEENVKSYYSFKRSFIRNLTTGPANLVLMFVDGASMAPTICDGDMVMIDMGRNNLRDGNLYAIGISDAILIKKVSLLPPGNKVLIISENDDYPSYEADLADIRVIGQVVWFCRTLVK